MLEFPCGRENMDNDFVNIFRWYSFGNDLLEGKIRSWEQGFWQKRTNIYWKIAKFQIPSQTILIQIPKQSCRNKYTDRFSSSRWVLYHLSASQTASYWKFDAQNSLGTKFLFPPLIFFLTFFHLFDSEICSLQYLFFNASKTTKNNYFFSEWNSYGS